MSLRTIKSNLNSRTSRTIILCAFANFINAADRVIMPITIIHMTDEFKWNLHWQGWILSSFAFGYLSSQIIGAFALNKFNSKTVLLFSVLLWSLSTLFIPTVANSFTYVIALRVILGIGEALGLPIMYHILAKEIMVEERSRAYSYLQAAGSIGQSVASVICPHLPWRYSFHLFGGLGIVWIFLWILFYSDTSSKSDQIPHFIPKMTRINTRWIEFLISWPLWAIYIAHFSMNWSSYIIMQWLPTYLTRNLGAQAQNLSFTAIPYIFNSIFSAASGHLADWLISHKWTILSVRRLMTAVGLLGPGFFLLIFAAVNSLAIAVILITISTMLIACNSAGHFSNHADVTPNHAGITFAISNTLATIPGILCGPLTAELVTASHDRWFPVFWLAAGINFVGAIIYLSQSSATQIL